MRPLFRFAAILTAAVALSAPAGAASAGSLAPSNASANVVGAAHAPATQPSEVCRNGKQSDCRVSMVYLVTYVVTMTLIILVPLSAFVGLGFLTVRLRRNRRVT